MLKNVMNKAGTSKVARILLAVVLMIGILPVAALAPAEKANAAEAYYVGQKFSGTCWIGTYWMVGEQSYFPVSSWTGELADLGGVTLHCINPTAANPYPQAAPYVATVTGIDKSLGKVYIDIVVTPKDATDGVTWDPRGWLTGYQRVGGSVALNRSFYGRLDLHKTSANPSITEGNDCYSLEGAEFTVYDNEGNEAGVLVTDENGISNSIDLPEGTYTVRETKAPEGYYTAPDQTVKVYSGEQTTVQVEDKPAGDPLSMLVGKYDGEKIYSGQANLPQGAASLAGAEFTVLYYDTVEYDSYDALMSANIEPTRTWVVETDEDGFSFLSYDYLVSGDDFYLNNNSNITIPRGSVVVYESKPPVGYKLNESVSFQKIQETPLEYITTYNTPQIPEQIKRGDIDFTKKGDLGDTRLSNVAFLITSETTGENHVIVTDANGQLSTSSAWAAHSANTNANDAAVTLEDGKYLVDESKLNPDAGIWFGEGEPNDSLGALIYDTYTVEELPCAANEGLQLVKETGIVISKHNFVVDLGTIDDPAMGIATVATNADDGSKLLVADGIVTVLDKVSYYGAQKGKAYTSHAQLMSVDDQGNTQPLMVNGQAVQSKSEFVAGATSGVVNVNLSFDALGVSGGDYVVFETVRDDQGRVVAEHKDAADADQTVTIVKPEISTSASDKVDGDKYVVADNEAVIIDRVTYRGLNSSHEYSYKAALTGFDNDGNVVPVTDADGNAIVIAGTFIPTAMDGSFDVEIPFDTSGYVAGDKFVVYEQIFFNDTLVASHEDPDDEGQTVEIARSSISTSASDDLDGDNLVVADKDAAVTDIVTYSHLIPGKEYELHGILMDKETGLPLLVGEGYDAVDAAALQAFADALIAAQDYASIEQLFADNAELAKHMVVGTAAFTPETPDGTVGVAYAFDASRFIMAQQPTDTVVFEWLIKDGLIPAKHTDFEDTMQTFSVVSSTIGTTASDKTDGDQVIQPSKSAVVVDKISYNNLIPGKEYKVSGILMDKATGKPLMINDKQVTAAALFTPNKPDGYAEVEFTFDSTGLVGKEIVVFETLAKDGVEVAVHANIEDAAQTVAVETPPPGKTFDKTGDNLTQHWWVVALLALAACGSAAYGIRQRKLAAAEDTGHEDETTKNSTK